MSLEQFAGSLGQAVSRKRFLAKVGGVSLAATVGALARPSSAKAYTYACCNLCQAPAQGCAAACSWCWQCCYSGTKYSCCEGYYPYYCGGQCFDIMCSYFRTVGSC
jgi:hypothetical protein